MNITSIGGGPGGLYASILLKRADPTARIIVYERNAPDDTFGFGVVFSAATLSGLEDADAPSYRALIDACARWDPVEVRFHGERLRGHGNRFAAISRHRLLRLLQDRARELEVDLRFETEVDVDEVRRDADLVLAADGINSATRTRFAETFGPTLKREGSKFIWLGTTKVFDVFTFVFLDTEWGPMQAHIYPFSESMSTFIVECAPDVWQRAGFDTVDAAALAPGVSDDESIKRLAALFVDHLDGHELVANNSKWLDWTTVSNRTWRHDNIVLLGDSAHTAHFSIGSGTKLAMEDAIALARALETADDLDEALGRYESDRKPFVERVQDAAGESLDWFTRYRRYWSFPPPQFAYSLLTRSRRVDHDNLRRRDPELVLGVDRWIAEEATGVGHDRPLLLPPTPARTPYTVAGLRLENRLVLLADDDQQADEGLPSPGYRQTLLARAHGGAGLVLAPRVAVAADARATPGDPGLYDDAHLAWWTEAIGSCAGAATVGVQLTHAGPRGSMRRRHEGLDLPLRAGGWPTVAASARSYTGSGPTPSALDRDGMDRIRDEFAAAAARAAEAGAGWCELQLARGELLASFLSPLTNHRDDDYGGDVHRRMAFPLEVLDAVRDVWPAGRPLSVCLTVDDLQRGGITEPDAVAIALATVEHGADLVHAVAGQTTPHAFPEYGRAYQAPYSDLVRNVAGVPALASGGVRGVSDADHLVAAGVADLVAVGLPLPAEPDWLAAHRRPAR